MRHGLAMIHGRSWRGGPGERELMDLSPAEGTTRPDFFWVAYPSRRSVSLRLVYADGSPCGGRHALGCSWGPVPCGIDPIRCSSAQGELPLGIPGLVCLNDAVVNPKRFQITRRIPLPGDLEKEISPSV